MKIDFVRFIMWKYLLNFCNLLGVGYIVVIAVFYCSNMGPFFGSCDNYVGRSHSRGFCNGRDSDRQIVLLNVAPSMVAGPIEQNIGETQSKR